MRRVFNSLRGRMLLVAAAAALLVLGVMAWHLPAQFERHVWRQQQEEMNWIFQQLILNLSRRNGRLEAVLKDPRFARPLGGHYWQIMDGKGQVLLRSRSLWDEVLSLPSAGEAGVRQFLTDLPGPGGRPLLALVRRVELDAGDGMRPYLVIVARERRIADEAVAAFRGDVWRGLALLGVVLLLAMLAVVASGLEPVQRLRRQVKDVQQGRRRRLDVSVVEELRPLAGEINTLLDKLEGDMERAGRRAAELAHGLKTPLAVLETQVREAREEGLADLAGRMQRQLERLEMAVRRELMRVRVGGGVRRAERTRLVETLRTLCRALQPLMDSRGITCELEVPVALENTEVRMSRGDLLELAGNILENGCKWASARVRVSLQPAPDGGVMLMVEDDGPGLDAGERRRVLDPGVRLDETREGQGLGLSIVRDIAESCGLVLSLRRAGLGGLCVCVLFPAGRVEGGMSTA